MTERLTTFLIVACVTALIWLFAEAESVLEQPLQVAFAISPDPAGDRYAFLAPGESAPVQLNMVIAGPVRVVDRAKSLLQEGLLIKPGAGLPLEPGDSVVKLAESLQSHPLLREANVTIVRVTPGTLRVSIRQLIARDASVSVVATGGAIEGTPEVRPASVKLLVPVESVASLPESPVVEARVDASRLTEGKAQTLAGVPLTAPAMPGVEVVRVQPPTVDVTASLRSRIATLTIASVPVQVRLAPAELSRWTIEIPDEDQFLTDVRVMGPSEIIEQIRAGTIQVVAVVQLSFRELERGIESKDAAFTDYPSSLSFEAANTTIRLRISRRTADVSPTETPASP
ncbi:MAG: hypothetical protein SFZ23_08975 [Planctomycetota bacterium]|nr:hypothetical protein [Planctomycetota bacterium]